MDDHASPEAITSRSSSSDVLLDDQIPITDDRHNATAPVAPTSSSPCSPRRRRRFPGRRELATVVHADFVYASSDEGISEWLKCPICLAPFVDPVVAPGCEHVFCRSCIATHVHGQQDNQFSTLDPANSRTASSERSVRRSSRGNSSSSSDGATSPTRASLSMTRCPTCRRAMQAHDLQPAPLLIRNMVDALPVKCRHYNRGCLYTCERSLVARHAQRDCGYAYVGEYFFQNQTSSSSKGVISNASGRCTCGKRILIKDSDAHRSSGDCIGNFVRCPHPGDQNLKCDALITESELKEHVETCDAKAFTCCDCDETILQGRRIAHERTCPERIVACPLARFGCAWTGRRQNLETSLDSEVASYKGHLDACVLKPLESFLLINEARVKTLEDDNIQMRQELASREKADIALKTSLQRCMDIIGLHAGDYDLHAAMGRSRSSDDHASPVSEPATRMRGLSQSAASSAEMSASTFNNDIGSSDPIDGTTSASAPAERRDWLWPREDIGQVTPNVQDGGPSHTSLRDPSSLMSTVSDLSSRLSALATSLQRTERRVDDAHVIGHSAAFEAGRAHDELNNVRHGMHAMRLQLHSMHMMQQQQRGGPPGQMLGMPGPGSTKSVGSSMSNPEAQGNTASSSPGRVPATVFSPYGPSPGVGPMIGLRRFWTGFEQTRL